MGLRRKEMTVDIDGDTVTLREITPEQGMDLFWAEFGNKKSLEEASTTEEMLQRMTGDTQRRLQLLVSNSDLSDEDAKNISPGALMKLWRFFLEMHTDFFVETNVEMGARLEAYMQLRDKMQMMMTDQEDLPEQ